MPGLAPGIPTTMAEPSVYERDGRDEPGHDESREKLKHHNTSGSLRGFGGACRFGGGAFGGCALLYPAHRPDRAFVQSDERHRERELAENIGRRQNRGDHEGDDNEIAPLRLELVGGDDADAAEQRENDRKLKRDAKR